MINWLLSQPWLPFLLIALIIVAAIFLKIFLVKLIIKGIHTIKEKRKK